MESNTTEPVITTPINKEPNFSEIRGLFINDSLNQKEKLFADHIEALKTYPEAYKKMIDRILKNNVELSLGTKARVLAACLAMHNHELANKLVSRSPYNFTMANTFGIAEVTKALSVLDTRRRIKALEKKLLRLQSRKAPASMIAPVKTLLNSLIEKEKVTVGSVSGSVSRWAARWTISIPKHELEFYALCMPKQPWKDLADLVHLKPTDFQHSWFLDYVYDRTDKAAQWQDNLLGECAQLKKLNTRETVDLLRRRHVPYSLLRRVFLAGSDKDGDDDGKPGRRDTSGRGGRGGRGGGRGGRGGGLVAGGGRSGGRGGLVARGGRGGGRGGRGGLAGRGRAPRAEGDAPALRTPKSVAAAKAKLHKKNNRKNKAIRAAKAAKAVKPVPVTTPCAVGDPNPGALVAADKKKKKTKARKPLPQRTKLSKRIRRAVLTYESIDIVLWYYDELHIGDEGDRIIASRFAYGDFPKLSYGKIMERVLYFKENKKGQLFYDHLLAIAQTKLSSLDVPISPPAVVIGDASGSMQVAIKTSTILSSIVCAVSNADLVFFDSEVIKPPCNPRTVAQVLQVAEEVKTRGATHNAIGLWKYYQRKIPLKFVFMVTDEEENGSAHGYRFNALFKKYREEVAPDCTLVYVSFLKDPKKPGQMVREALKPEFNLQPLQFRLNLSRPDLTKVDSWLGLLALESRTFDELQSVTFVHKGRSNEKPVEKPVEKATVVETPTEPPVIPPAPAENPWNKQASPLPKKKSVMLSASFTNWSPLYMPWSAQLKAHVLKMPLPPGRHYFQYRVDDVAELDPTFPTDMQLIGLANTRVSYIDVPEPKLSAVAEK